MTFTHEIVITARAKSFSNEGVRKNSFLVLPDGAVKPWDPVAGHYTSCHGMSERGMSRIRRLAAIRVPHAVRA